MEMNRRAGQPRRGATLLACCGMAVALGVNLVLGGCAGRDADAPSREASPIDARGYPHWVMNPSSDEGLASSACVSATGTLGRDRGRANLEARQQLGIALGNQIQSMAEGYGRLTETGEEEVPGGELFEQVTRSLVNERIAGSRVAHSAYLTLRDGSQQYCTMMVLGEEQVLAIISEVAARTAVTEEGFTQPELREQYMTQEALNRLYEQLREDR
ncbi:hypothetical protein CKO15_04380 [Halorhodospira abdelmalekii]|uniref:hypothetical protein n=1 Tax=Halorhodospira abdelmalekii TaxID=421629 RepID=UPI001907C9A6|nr:hypothetical protein [Halorhodospira abdelmalekii]MBK1734534.1 hypothetical protein [Halorhodospira abdelmalekii]